MSTAPEMSSKLGGEMHPKCVYKTAPHQVASKRELVGKTVGHLYTMQLTKKSQKVSVFLYGENIYLLGEGEKGTRGKRKTFPHNTPIVGLSV